MPKVRSVVGGGEGESAPEGSPAETFAPMLEKARALLGALEASRKASMLVLLGDIGQAACLVAIRVLRRMGQVDRLEVVLESPGGDLS